jgi:hypothetical protein
LVYTVVLKEGHRSRSFENRVPRTKFGSFREEVTEGLRKLHNEKHNSLHAGRIGLIYYWADQIREDEMGGKCNAYRRDKK